MALTDNLISYWKMDEASGNAIDAHGSNDLTDNNTVGSATGKISNARSFNGSDESFSRADNADLSLGDIDCTFTLWVYLDNTGSFRPFIYKDNGLGASEYTIVYNGSTFRFRVSASGSLYAVTNGSPSAGVWYFLAARHDATANQISLSINAGTPATLSHSIGIDNNTSDFEVGRTSYFGFYHDGLIDEIGFWKRHLSDAEITELYNSGAGLAYPFSGGGGGAVVSQLCLLGVG